MDGCQEIDLELEDDGLIDDNQFSENSAGFNTNELVGGLNSDISENDKLSELREPVEPVRNQRKGRYNLRKSLAWDSAFFTSAGVLDAEELTTMITGVDKCEKRLLPRIQEELTESTESLSSLGSDTLTMETLEGDLFVDIRASIQRSSKRASDLRILNSKTAAMEVDSAGISSLEKEDPVTQIKEIAIIEKTPKPGVKKSSSLPTERISSKCQPKQNIEKIGSGKAIKQDPVHSQAPTAKTGETKSILLKAPKTISRPIPTSTVAGKRESIGTGRARSSSGISNPGATVSGKGPQPPKVSSLGGARREALPKSSLSSSSSLLASSIASSVHSTRSSTSSDSSSTMSSKINPVKSNLMTPRRNTGKSGDAGTGPIPKTPSRTTLKNKVPPPSSTLSAYMMSNKISSSVSPASSISEWSSVSSSSSSMVNQKSSNSRTSIDTSSCRSMEGGITHLQTRKYPPEQNADDGHKNQGVGLTSNNSKKSSMQTGGNLCAPAKPSGLRMPSHKFGFFDGGKSSTRSPNKPQQSPSAVNNGIPKNSIPIRTSNSKQKMAKAPTTRMATSPASIKPSSPKPSSLAGLNASSPKPSYQASSQQKSHTLADTSIVSKDVVKSPILSVEVKGGSASEEACREAEKVETRTGVKQVVADTGGAIAESLGDLKINDALGCYNVVVDKSHLEKDFEPSCEAIEKENGYDDSTHPKFNGPVDELLDDTSPCRPPFTLKNSFASDDCSDMPKEFVTQVADKNGFLLPESEAKEC